MYKQAILINNLNNRINELETRFTNLEDTTFQPAHGSFSILVKEIGGLIKIVSGNPIPFSVASSTNTNDFYINQTTHSILFNTAGIYEISYTIVPVSVAISTANTPPTGPTVYPVEIILGAYLITTSGEESLLPDSQLYHFGSVGVGDADIDISVNMSPSLSITFPVAISSGQAIKIVNLSTDDIYIYADSENFPAAIITINRIGPLVSQQ